MADHEVRDTRERKYTVEVLVDDGANNIEVRVVDVLNNKVWEETYVSLKDMGRELVSSITESLYEY